MHALEYSVPIGRIPEVFYSKNKKYVYDLELQIQKM